MSSLKQSWLHNGNNNQTVKDTAWLTLDICNDFLKGCCYMSDDECRYAHPPLHVEINGNRVTCCYDYLKSKCRRSKPPCRYLHPPYHLKEKLFQNGKHNLAIKAAIYDSCKNNNINHHATSQKYNHYHNHHHSSHIYSSRPTQEYKNYRKNPHQQNVKTLNNSKSFPVVFLSLPPSTTTASTNDNVDNCIIPAYPLLMAKTHDNNTSATGTATSIIYSPILPQYQDNLSSSLAEEKSRCTVDSGRFTNGNIQPADIQVMDNTQDYFYFNPPNEIRTLLFMSAYPESFIN